MCWSILKIKRLTKDPYMMREEAYKILTITHQDIRLDEMGKFVVEDNGDDTVLEAKLRKIMSALKTEELYYLPTCNRILFMFYHEGHVDVEQAINDILSIGREAISTEDLQTALNKFNYYEGQAALRHLMEVASSVNSLVVGEREILRQMRTAFDKCLSMGISDSKLRIPMRFAVECAKAVYSRTSIGERPVSVVSLAIQRLLEQSPAKDARILLVGAGQTNLLVSKFLTQHQFTNYTVFNRTTERAEKLAASLKGQAYNLDELATYNQGFDIMFVCTGATEPVITTDIYRGLLKGEISPKIIIDLSVPHNVSQEVSDDNQNSYTCVEDLRELAQQNLDFRHREIKKAELIINEYLKEFDEDFFRRRISGVLQSMPDQMKKVRHKAEKQVFHKEIEQLNPEARELVQKLLDYMEKGAISAPILAMKQQSKAEQN